MQRRTTMAPAGLIVLAMAAAASCWSILRPPASNAASCPATSFPMRQATGGIAPYIDLTVGRRTGAFLIDFGATASSVSAEAFPPERHGQTTVQPFSLPTFTTGAFKVRRYHVSRTPPGGQLGIVGTDFLSLVATDLRLSTGGGEARIGPLPCISDADGLTAIDQTGFFSHDPRRLAAGRPNVPVLYLAFGSVTAWAQIDTGYDDAVLPYAIDINEPLRRRLVEAGLQLVAERPLDLDTCEGPERRQVLSVAGAKVAITTATGEVLREIPAPRLVLKAPNGCGGIAGMAEPAAQVGMSVLRLLGRAVFDPLAERVWIPRAGAQNPP